MITPNKLYPTEQVLKVYDQLRKEILKMFCLQKHIKKKEEEKQLIQDRCNEINSIRKLLQVPPQMQAYPGFSSHPMNSAPQIN